MSFLPSGPYSCVACGQAYALENSAGLCPACRLVRQHPNQPLARQRREAQEREALMAELGMPPEARQLWKRIRLRGAVFGPRYQGYALDLFGLSVPSPSTWPPPWPYWRLAGIVVQLWQQLVRFEGCPLWGEVRWHPERGEQVTIHGLEERHSPDDLKRVHLGLRLLREAVRGGRPKGTGTFESREAFQAVVAPAVRELRRRGLNPTTGAVRRYLRPRLGDIDRAQFTRWYQSFGWRTWQDFLGTIEER